MDGELKPEQSEDVGQIHKSGVVPLGVINDILPLKKIEAGKIEFAIQEIDLEPVAEQVMTTLYQMAEAKALKLACDVSPSARVVLGDPGRVREILTNLVSNAIKFTPTGSVTIRSLPAGSMAEISVIDTGIGISRDAHNRIFEEFRQANDKISSTYGG